MTDVRITEQDVKSAVEFLNRKNPRSCWQKGVYDFAYSLMGDLLTAISEEKECFIRYSALHETLTNGCKAPHAAYQLSNHPAKYDDWVKYSYGGMGFIYDDQIVEMLATPSEQKKIFNSRRYKEEGKVNKDETALQMQARALYQAEHLIERLLDWVLVGTYNKDGTRIE